MSNMATGNPQTSSGLGGAQISAPQTDDPNFYIPPVNAIGVPQNMGLPAQEGLPNAGAPLGAYTDDQYLQADAALRAQIGQQYAQILQQLGYQDPNTGNVIPGTVVQNANIQLAQQQQQEQQALQGVVQNAQNNGTLFSGIRQTQTAQAESPFQQNMAQLGLTTSQSLQDLYNQAQNLVTQYNTSNQQNLSDAANRNLALIQANALLAAAKGGGAGATSTGTTSDSTGVNDGQLGGPPVSSQPYGSAPSNTLGAINLAAHAASNPNGLAGTIAYMNGNLNGGYGAAPTSSLSAIGAAAAAGAAKAPANNPGGLSGNLTQGTYATH